MIRTKIPRILIVLGGVFLLTGPVASQQLGPLPANSMRAHFINVGQADATLLQFNCGVVLIDAGAENDAMVDVLISYLRNTVPRRLGRRHINSIIITHSHIDHTRALDDVVRSFAVDHVVENGQRADPTRTVTGEGPVNWVRDHRSQAWLQIDDADIGDDAGLWMAEVDAVDGSCNGFTDPIITILSADLAADPGWGDDRYGRAHFDNKNNHSIVVRVDYGDASFLFTGDLEEPAIETLLQFYARSEMLDVDVYQAGHHGSHNGTTVQLLRALNHPEIAIISMGRCDRPRTGRFNAWSYGHPRDVVFHLLAGFATGTRGSVKTVNVATGVRSFRAEAIYAAVYATGWDGHVVVEATADGSYRVTTQGTQTPTC